MRFKARYIGTLVKLAAGVGATTAGSAVVNAIGPTFSFYLTALLGAGSVLSDAVKEVTSDGAKELFKSAVSSGWSRIAGTLAGTRADGQLPANHDLLRAVRQAWLLGLQHCITRCRSDVERYRSAGEYAEAFEDQLQRCEDWIDSELQSSARDDYFAGVSAAEDSNDGLWSIAPTLHRITERVRDAQTHDTSGALFTNLYQEALDEVLAELHEVLGAEPQGPLKDWIFGFNVEHGGGYADYAPGWRLAATACFAEMVKHDPVLHTVVFQLQMDRVVGGIDQIIAQAGELRHRLEAVDGQLAMLQAQISLDVTQRLDVLLQLARGGEAADVVERLRIAFPRGTQWTQTAAQVRERIARLRGLPVGAHRCARLESPFVGREVDLDALDGFLDTQSRGVMVLAAPTGFGKSALMAEWMVRRERAGDRIVRHFISTSHDKTREAAEITGHLLAQLSELADVGDAQPDSARATGQNLHTATSRYSDGSRRLIILIDGLDETLTVLQPFVEHDLAERVYVVVSCRAEQGAWPSPLRPWLKRKDSVPFFRRDLAQLAEHEVDAWLHAEGVAVPAALRRQLVRRLWKGSDQGTPLFLQFLIDDLRQPGSVAAWSAELAQAGPTALPDSFSRYICEQFEALQGVPEVWSESHQWLVATLCAAKGALHRVELIRLLSRLRDKGEAISSLGPSELTRDYRLTRWLTIVGSAGNDAYSLAHPLLAKPLKAVLGQRVDDAQANLVAWAASSWSSNASSTSSAYALAWLPAHLKETDERAAALLLCEPAFLLERLREPARAVDGLTLSMDEWAGLPVDAQVDARAQAWTAFWAENETRLKWAISLVRAAGRPPADIVRDCLADGGIQWADGEPMRARARQAHRAPLGGLRRSIDDAHRGPVLGIVQFGESLVSWGERGAVHFWSARGQALPGLGAERAHVGRVNGLLQVGDALVSWGNDGAIRFWSLDGQAQPGRGASDAHRREVYAVLRFGDSLVSRGSDGAVRFWSLDGQPQAGRGSSCAHPDGVNGVQKFGDFLVSWGQEGAIRFWSLDGQALPDRGASGAHDGAVRGVLQFGDALVSWGRDGMIRFWSLDGQALPDRGVNDTHLPAGAGFIELRQFGNTLVSWGRGDGAIQFWSTDGRPHPGRGAEMTHRASLSGSIEGMRQFGDGLVSWGRGAIRFWSLDGEPRPELGMEFAHDGPVWGVEQCGDKLVSFGNDGAIRFWSPDGQLLPGLDYAHDGPVNGVGQFGQILVSWGYDGDIRFWSLQAQEGPDCGDTDPRGTWVTGAQQFGDALVSWGEDGAIRFWSLDGQAQPGRGADDAHAGPVKSVQRFGDSLVSWGGDKSIRFWSLDGQAQAAGDAADAHRVLFVGGGNGVGGVLQVGDDLVSWGTDGAIHFWSLDGRTRPGRGADDAHEGVVNGVVQCGESLVSWGQNGAIRFWSHDGRPLPGRGASRAHNGSVIGVNEFAGVLASWGTDGAIRFWSLEGQPLPGRGAAARASRFFSDHGVSGMRRFGDCLVSWGQDGALRFWSLDGQALPGRGSDCAHPGGVTGVQQFGNGLVSWGKEGAVRFWSSDGQSLPGRGALDAHRWISPRDGGRGGVRDVRQFGECLISWGHDGTIRCWSLNGQELDMLVVPGGFRHLAFLNEDRRLIAYGRSVWTYDFPLSQSEQ